MSRNIGATAGPNEAVGRWSRTAERWRLSKGEAARLLRLPRSGLVGVTPRGPFDDRVATRMEELSDAADVVEIALGSAALALRWLRFPLAAEPGVRAIDRLCDDLAFAAALSRSVAR